MDPLQMPNSDGKVTDGKYEVQRAIRFELNPVKLHRPYVIVASDASTRRQDIATNMENLESSCQKIHSIIKNALFYPHKGDNFEKETDMSKWETAKSVQFKYSGMEKVFRREWFDEKKNIIKYSYDKKTGTERKSKNYMTLQDLDGNNFLYRYFIKWIKENAELFNEFSKFSFKQEYDLGRISDIGDFVRRIRAKNSLGVLFSLFDGVHIKHKNDTRTIDEITNELETAKSYIEALDRMTRPMQSTGIPHEYATFNYFAKNKTPKNYEQYGKDILEKEKILDNEYVWKDSEKKNTVAKFIKIEKLSIKELYEQMKRFKADQKSAFMEQLQNKVEYNSLSLLWTYIDNKEITHEGFKNLLFTQITGKSETYDVLVELTEDITAATNKDVRKRLKMQRGAYFGNKTFPDYSKFCDIYKSIAMEYGKKKAEVTSLKREKIESVKERGFSFLGKHNSGMIRCYTFPNSKSKSAYNPLLGENDAHGTEEYVILHSITLRAFEKQCFGIDSSFVTEIVKKLDQKYLQEVDKYKNNFPVKVTVLQKKKILAEQNLLLPLLIEILNLETSLKIHYRSPESLAILSNSKTMEELEENIKKECYILELHKTTEEKLTQILDANEGNIYEVTSWDLEKTRKHPEQYTKWWEQFWGEDNKQSKYPIRLNPEILVSYVEKGENLPLEKQRSRRKEARYILTATLSHHADKKNEFAHFIEDDMKHMQINNFNKQFNATNRLEYIYGIDKGTNELITLGIFRKNGESIEKFAFGDMVPVYRITDAGCKKTKTTIKQIDGKETVQSLYKNPAQFLTEFYPEYLDDPAIFEKIPVVSCLGNLTSAKVIDGKIVLNGDMNTVFSLYKTGAKRIIYESITQGKNNLNTVIIYNVENKCFVFGGTEDRYQKIMKIDENIESIISIVGIETIMNELNNYVNKIRNFDPKTDSAEDISIQKINNLRGAVCANILGVILKLQESFPGWIAFEALKNDALKQNQNPAYFANTMNEKLYSKLQLLNQVPPILKKFRSEISAGLQHGKVLYIDETYTSELCPSCRIKTLYGHGTRIHEHEMHHYQEGSGYEYQKMNSEKEIRKVLETTNTNCTYNMKTNPIGFEFLKSGDDLATYNIAQKGIDVLLGRVSQKPLETKLENSHIASKKTSSTENVPIFKRKK